MHHPRILLGTLHVDENERDSCTAALAAQSYTEWTHRIFSGLSNEEAHRRLYRYFMDNREDYQLFIKLDADMVLRSRDALADIVRVFQDSTNLDHAVFLVHDWMSDMQIVGMHVFSNRVSWTHTDEQLFVDPDPERPGEKLVIEGYPSPIAEHSPDPSPFQAFRFGVHRASKILQPFNWWVDVAQAGFQWDLLTRIWETYCKAGDRRRMLALLGAQWLLSRGAAGRPLTYTDVSVSDAYAEICHYDDDKLESLLLPAWRTRAGRFWMRYRRNAFRTAVSGIGRAVVRMTRTLLRTAPSRADK